MKLKGSKQEGMDTTEKAGAESRCPLIRELRDECYCTDMSSQRIGAAIYYCIGHFEECEIYRKLSR